MRSVTPALRAWKTSAISTTASESAPPGKLSISRSSSARTAAGFTSKCTPTSTAGPRTSLGWRSRGIGADETPSPIRSFTIRTKEDNPTWVVPASILKTMNPPRHVVPPGPDNPLGEYRIRLSYGLYSIHGTDSPWSIGRLATHGCIRLYPDRPGPDLDLLPRFRRLGVEVQTHLREVDDHAAIT